MEALSGRGRAGGGRGNGERAWCSRPITAGAGRGLGARPRCLLPVPALGGSSLSFPPMGDGGRGGRRPMSGGGGRGLEERPGEADRGRRPPPPPPPLPARPGPALTARRHGDLRRPQHPAAAGGGRILGAAGSRYRFSPFPAPVRPGPVPLTTPQPGPAVTGGPRLCLRRSRARLRLAAARR